MPEKDSTKIAIIQFNLEFLSEKKEIQQPKLSLDDMMYAA